MFRCSAGYGAEPFGEAVRACSRSERASWDAPLRAARLNRCKATAMGMALGLAGWHRAAPEQGEPSQACLVWLEITACAVRGALWQALNDAVWGRFSSQH